MPGFLQKLLAIVACLSAVLLPTRLTQAAVTVAFSADTEGHVGPCRTCPMHVGLGGLDRRATAMKQLPAPAVFVDAGNALAGPDSLASRGEVITAAYDAIGYQAINLSHRDLALGKDRIVELAGKTRAAVVSANILDAATSKPLVKPFLVVKSGEQRLAFIGLAEAPAGLTTLPHLRRQFAGLKFAPPAEALKAQLPLAKAEADVVIVLYYGSAGGLDAVGKASGNGVAAILVAGLRPEELPAAVAGQPLVLATSEHGKHLGRLMVSAQGAQAGEALAVLPELQPDEAMTKLLAQYRQAEPQVLIDKTPIAQPPVTPSPVTLPTTKPAAPTTLPLALPTSRPTPEPPIAVPNPVPNPPVAPPVMPPPVVPQKVTRVPVRQPHVPKGLAGVGLTQEQVDAAILRGCKFIWADLQAKLAAHRGQFGAGDDGYMVLSCLALTKAGYHKVDPKCNAVVRQCIEETRAEDLGTYATGCLCMLIEAYGDAKYEPTLRRAAKYLFEGYGNTGWDYTPKVPESALDDPRSKLPLQVWGGKSPEGTGAADQWKRASTQPVSELERDNSLAQYALLGMQAASRAGVEVPAETWKFALDLYRKRQDDDGGWGYTIKGSTPNGGLTCAGIYALAICRFHLGEADPFTDDGIERGLAWLVERFSIGKNPGGGAYQHYYLYATERLGRTLGTEFLGPHEWYPLGARHLVDSQRPDGSWADDNDLRFDHSTSFGVLFLVRSTPKLKADPPKPDAPGILRTAIAQPPSPKVYLILDCSGSMMAEVGGRTKFDQARQAVSDLVAALPDQTDVALRVYGHRKTAIDPDADTDTELLQPLAPLDRQALADRLRSLRARGKTPMATSMKQAATDLASAGGAVDVILLTDGGEDSIPRQDPAAAAAELANIKGVRVQVIGFDIGRADWGEQLQSIARRGRGRYWAAGDAATLTGGLRSVVLRTPGSFELLDGGGRSVVRGAFGDKQSVPPGAYTFVTAFGDRAFRETVWINPGGTTSVVFDAGKIDVPASQTQPTSPELLSPIANPAQTPAVAPVPARPKFCVNCGNKLAPTGKFCTNCGKKIGS